MLSLEQVHEKQSLETPEIAVFYSVHQAKFSLSQIWKEVQKLYSGEGPEWLFFFLDQCNNFFQLPNLKIYRLPVEVAACCIPGEKRLKMNNLGLYALQNLYPTQCATATECDKKQRGHAGYWASEYIYPIEQ